VAGKSLIRLCAALCGAAGIALAAANASAEQIVRYKIVDDASIPQSLTGKPGDPARGRKVAINRKLGNCLACHQMPISEELFHGAVGPDLSAVGSTLSEAEVRLRVVNPKIVNPDTIMPAFYRTEGLHRVIKKFQGKPMLSAQQVEDVVAYLMTLKGK